MQDVFKDEVIRGHLKYLMVDLFKILLFFTLCTGTALAAWTLVNIVGLKMFSCIVAVATLFMLQIAVFEGIVDLIIHLFRTLIPRIVTRFRTNRYCKSLVITSNDIIAS